MEAVVPGGGVMSSRQMSISFTPSASTCRTNLANVLWFLSPAHSADSAPHSTPS